MPDLSAQWLIKGGIAISGYQPHGGDRYIVGNDYRPFLGYEVDWLQDDYAYPDLGFQVGFAFLRPISHRSAIQPELYIAQRGVSFIHKEWYNTAYYLNVTYLQLPLLFKHRLTSIRKIQPGFMTGPYSSIKLLSKRKLEIWDDVDQGRVSGISTWDMGWILGLTTEWAAWSGRIHVELRMEYGLRNAMFEPEAHTELYVDHGKVRLMCVSLLTAYQFGGP